MCRIRYREEHVERTLLDGSTAHLTYEVPESEGDRRLIQRIAKLRRKLPWIIVDACAEAWAEVNADFSRRQDMGIGEPPDHWRIPEPTPTDQVMRMRRRWYHNAYAAYEDDPWHSERILAGEQRVRTGAPAPEEKINHYGFTQREKQQRADENARYYNAKFMVCALCETEFSPHQGQCPKCGNDDLKQFGMRPIEEVTNGYSVAFNILHHSELGRRLSEQVKAEQGDK